MRSFIQWLRLVVFRGERLGMTAPGVGLAYRLRKIGSGVQDERVSRIRVAFTVVLIVGAVAIFTSGTAARAQPATFEVASVKPSGTGFRGTTAGEDGSYRANGVTLKMLVSSAYGVPEFRVEGGPGWAGSDRWDIDARTGVAERLSGPKLEAPLRALLEQRFQLRATVEPKEGSVYFLDVAKGGVKMKQSAESAERPMIGFGNGMIASERLNTSLLVGTLTRYLGREVIDRTGLTAAYEVHVSWTPDAGEGDPLLAGAKPPPGAEQRSLFAALEEDLGLKLTSGKQNVLSVKIVSAQRPGEN